MTMPQPVEQALRILIVDDHALIAQGVAVALEAEGVEVAVSTGPTSGDVLRAARSMHPDVVLLDLQLEGQIGSGLSLIDPLRAQGAQVLVLTGVTDRLRLAECLERGAVGIMSKSDPFDELVSQVLAAGTGEAVTPEAERIAMVQELRIRRAEQRERVEPLQRLTPRESAVLGELMTGKQAEAIATGNYVSIATVRSQIRSILQKLDVNSQLSAVAMARELGWTPPA